MIRSLESGSRSALDFLTSEKGTAISGGIIVGALAFMNMNESGMNRTIAETLVNAQGDFLRSLLPSMSSAREMRSLYALAELYTSVSSGFIGYASGFILTRKLICS